MAVRDESIEARLVRMCRQMSPVERSEIAAQMFEDALALVRASIRQSHPHFSHAEIQGLILDSDYLNIWAQRLDLVEPLNQIRVQLSRT